MWKYSLIVSTVTALAAFAPQTQAQNAPSDTPSTKSADKEATDFIKQAIRGNDMEIAMAELGLRKAENASLKTFCQQLQKDHMKANEDLGPIAQRYGVTVDQELKRRDTRELSQFDKLAGNDFDKKFATDMLRDHAKDINEFNKALQKALPADVKQYAQTMLPKLQQHFQQAQTVARAVGVDPSTISSYSKKLPANVGGTGTETDQGVSSEKGAGAKQLEQPQPPPSGAQQ